MKKQSQADLEKSDDCGEAGRLAMYTWPVLHLLVQATASRDRLLALSRSCREMIGRKRLQIEQCWRKFRVGSGGGWMMR